MGAATPAFVRADPSDGDPAPTRSARPRGDLRNVEAGRVFSVLVRTLQACNGRPRDLA